MVILNSIVFSER